jgi:hypothetical protein
MFRLEHSSKNRPNVPTGTLERFPELATAHWPLTTDLKPAQSAPYREPQRAPGWAEPADAPAWNPSALAA